MDPFTTAIIAATVLAAWDYGRRWLQIRLTEAGAARNYEKAYSILRDELRHTGEELDSTRLRVEKLESESSSAEGVKAQFIGIQRSVNDAIESAKAANKELDSLAPAIKSLGERCDKNSTAIVNTAEAMQKLLNEKFTALALRGGVNQRPG